MNRGPHMIVLCDADRADRARRFADSILDAMTSAAPSFEVVTIESFDPAVLPRCHAALVIINEHPEAIAPLWRRLFDLLAESEIATLALVDGAEDGQSFNTPPAAVLADQSASSEHLACRLESLLHQQTVIRRLQAELSVAQRFQGGLRGEISRIHEELQLAAMVQQEFLPRSLPTLHGVHFAALWRPANYVSGDIYDISRLDEDHIGVFIADAVGHGVPAALMTMVIARALPTKEIDGRAYRIVPPSEALSRLNQEMIRRQGASTRFATAVYAVIDCRSRITRIAGAGHPPPMLLRDGEDMQELVTTGGLLGVFDDETFDEIEVELQLGDRLLLYSDGFEVAFPKSDTERDVRLPTKRYIDEFRSLAQLHDPEEMISEMAVRLDQQPGSLHQIDDLTLICLQAGGVAPRESADDPDHERFVSALLESD